MRLSVPQEWLLWMTKTTNRFKYRLNPDIALTFQIRAPEEPTSKLILKPTRMSTPEATPEPTPEPASVQPKRRPGRPRKIIIEPEEHDEFQPAKPKRGPGRPRKVIAHADSDADYHKENQKDDDRVDGDITKHVEDMGLEGLEGENAEDWEMDVTPSVEQDDY
ncbi:unnamed protein product [Sordaria macrospora k-hell]|uniref:WGS project CABT00000000 data, contig 2.10 n=2 Tax=Sordaria macrospora TaxID=5147 RepID=F7VWK5_SORMK|nr:uncharacterized protein SMAC_03329 [Sordaria macrospora k-hell]CCC09773.1 unnamed protein product [Sordaria macrospora k-hell]